MRRATFRPVFALLVVALTLGGSAAAKVSQNDAGSGVDAGASWSTAMELAALGTYQATLVEHDADAFVVSQPSSSPTCVLFSVATTSADSVTIHAPSGASDTTVTFPVASGSTVSGGLATRGYDAVGLLATLQNPELDGLHAYNFSLGRQGFPDFGLVTPTATGHSLPSALPLPGPCTSGTIGGATPGGADVYSLGTVAAGSTLVGSLGTNANNLVVSILDASGNVVAQSTSTASTTALSTGTYYLQVSRTDFSIQEGQYLLGSMIDPGPACAPAC